MKLLLMADNSVGLKVTLWLISQHREDIALVAAASENEIYRTAQLFDVPCIASGSSKEVQSYCQSMGLIPDLGCLVWWPRIIRSPLLELPRSGFINTHPSWLPFNRGKHYNFWAIVEQSPFGVTLHFAEEGIDTGDIVAQRPIGYNWEDSGGSLYRKAIEATVDLFKESYPTIRQLNIPSHKQDLSKGTFHLAKELNPASHINLNKEYQARDLLNLLRARTFPGHPACWFEDDGKEYEVRIEIKEKNHDPE